MTYSLCACAINYMVVLLIELGKTREAQRLRGVREIKRFFFLIHFKFKIPITHVRDAIK